MSETWNDRIVALGVSGGPKLAADGAKPALALVVADRTYLVDAGFEAAKQLVAAGLGFSGLHNIFITHNHLDHTSGLFGVLAHGWTNLGAALPATVHIWGPPPTARLTNLTDAAYAHDIENYVTGGGFGPFPGVELHDVTVPASGGVLVMEDEWVKVTATRVFHGDELANAYAYRFDIKASGASVVFSGDTAAPDANLIALAQGCDFLVHETQDNDNVEKLVSRLPEPKQSELRHHLLSSHSSVEDLPLVAKLAGAKNLVLSHYTPLPQPPEVYLAKAQAAAAKHGYTGRIVAPTELDEIPLAN